MGEKSNVNNHAWHLFPKHTHYDELRQKNRYNQRTAISFRQGQIRNQKFHEEQIKKAPADKKAFAAMIEASRQTANHLFLAFRFTLSGIANGMVESTMKSYVSYIKRINRELFCKTGYDLLYDYLPGYVKNKNIAKIDEMFGAMDDKLTERIENLDETEMPVSHLKNARTALSKYANFIRSVIDQAD